MYQVKFSPNAWLDYIYWKKTDVTVKALIDDLVAEICESPFDGRGKPVQLKYDMNPIWTRRIDLENRLVYRIQGTEIQIIQCKYHY